MIKLIDEIPAVKEYLKRIGAEARSMRKAVVTERSGQYWEDIDTIHFSKTGEVKCKLLKNEPTEAEQEAFLEAFKDVEWPALKPVQNIINPPPMIKNAEKKNIFEFRNKDNQLVMVQVRVEDDKGGKNYVPWTYWSDNQWRCLEPEGNLPLFNAHRLKEAGTVFIHEGAKAAKHVQWMVDGETPEARDTLARHPWCDELKHAVHVGWIGGAQAHYRTDWKILNELGIKTAYIVADNDSDGLGSVKHIAEHLKMNTYHVQFDEQFPAAFDLADPFPEELFTEMDGGEKVYQGPNFADSVHPATWATDLIPVKKGRPMIKLRPHFRDQWAYLQDMEMFVNIKYPNKLRSKESLNSMVAPFSHTMNTAQLILKDYRGTRATLCYRPDMPEKDMIDNKGEASINLYRPPTIKPLKGDPTPFLKFMEYMFVNKDEREQMLRWTATMIARPDIRMRFGVLLVSEAQGIGKSTLGLKILKPLVGHSNVSLPGEGEITHNDFNGWIGGKRLAIVNEIYHGHSWKAYNKLKSVMADDEITINEKYVKSYPVENWIQVFACSNSMRCLRIERDDRRWLFPEMTEEPWPKQKFDEFFSWLRMGGLNIILWWAQEFKNYVSSTERAPMTQRKEESIIESQSEAEREAGDLAMMMQDSEDPIAITMRTFRQWLGQQCREKIYETDYELRKAMRNKGIIQYHTRFKVDNRQQYILMNSQLSEIVYKTKDDKVQRDLIRSHMKSPHDILKVDV